MAGKEETCLISRGKYNRGCRLLGWPFAGVVKEILVKK